MATVPRSPWREEANRIIAETLATLPADASLKDKRQALRNAYPWGARKNHPYFIWCSAVRIALGSTEIKDKTRRARMPLDYPPPTGDDTLDRLAVALADEPYDLALRLVLLDRMEEIDHPFAGKARNVKPTLRVVVQRLWPRARCVETRSRLDQESRQIKGIGGGSIPAKLIEDHIEGINLFLVDPDIMDAVNACKAQMIMYLLEAARK